MSLASESGEDAVVPPLQGSWKAKGQPRAPLSPFALPWAMLDHPFRAQPLVADGQPRAAFVPRSALGFSRSPLQGSTAMLRHPFRAQPLLADGQPRAALVPRSALGYSRSPLQGSTAMLDRPFRAQPLVADGQPRAALVPRSALGYSQSPLQGSGQEQPRNPVCTVAVPGLECEAIAEPDAGCFRSLYQP
jgi:hypothetical protein